MNVLNLLIVLSKVFGWLPINKITENNETNTEKKNSIYEKFRYCRTPSIILILGEMSFSIFYLWRTRSAFRISERTAHVYNRFKNFWDFITCSYLLLNGFCKSSSLQYLFKMNYALQKSETIKIPIRMRTDVLFLLACFSFIPIEISVLIKANFSPKNMTIYVIDIIIYRTMNVCIIVPSGIIMLIFYRFTINIILSFKESQIIFQQQLRLMKKSRHLLETADAVNTVNLKILKINQFIKEMSDYFAIPFVFILSYAFFSTLSGTFYLIYADSLGSDSVVWSGLTILHYMSFFIPVITTPSFFLYQVIISILNKKVFL